MRPSADSVLFDLDGTLWDTGETCAVAWNDVLRRHGIPYRRIVADDVRRVTGRPHEAAIRDAFPGLSDDQLAALTVATAEEDNRLIAEQGGVLYPGVERGPRALADRKARTSGVSSTATVSARRRSSATRPAIRARRWNAACRSCSWTTASARAPTLRCASRRSLSSPTGC